MKKPAKPATRRRVLLVEDHRPTREALSRVLKDRHFEVVAAGTYAESSALAEKEKFDLLISDIGLPDGDGYALMHRLRHRHGMRGIALTAFGMEEDIELSKQAGFEAHLIKPVKVGVLDRALAKLKF
jgi:CheY-like chemotaxis protein